MGPDNEFLSVLKGGESALEGGESAVSPVRHSFKASSLAKIAGADTERNRFGQRVGKNNGYETKIDESKIKVGTDEDGNRTMSVSIFDSPAMLEFTEKLRREGKLDGAVDWDKSLSRLTETLGQAGEGDAAQMHAEVAEVVSLEDDSEESEEERAEEEFQRLAEQIMQGKAQPIPFFSLPPAEPSSAAPKAETYATRVATTRVATAPAMHYGKAPLAATCANAICRCPIPEGAKFCPECGQKQVATSCPECDYRYVGAEKFCPECGHRR